MIKHSTDGMLTEINVGIFSLPLSTVRDHLFWEWQLLWLGSLQGGRFHKAVQFIQFHFQCSTI